MNNSLRSDKAQLTSNKMRVFSWYSLGMKGPRMWQTYMNWFSVLTNGFQCSLKSLANNNIYKSSN